MAAHHGHLTGRVLWVHSGHTIIASSRGMLLGSVMSAILPSSGTSRRLRAHDGRRDTSEKLMSSEGGIDHDTG
jgi:hypothetical protein